MYIYGCVEVEIRHREKLATEGLNSPLLHTGKFYNFFLLVEKLIVMPCLKACKAVEHQSPMAFFVRDRQQQVELETASGHFGIDYSYHGNRLVGRTKEGLANRVFVPEQLLCELLADDHIVGRTHFSFSADEVERKNVQEVFAYNHGLGVEAFFILRNEIVFFYMEIGCGFDGRMSLLVGKRFTAIS